MRWTEWHTQNIEAIQATLNGQDGQLAAKVPLRINPALTAKYTEGISRAAAWRESYTALQQQSTETIKVLTVATKVLETNNNVALEAIGPRLKAIIAAQESATESCAAKRRAVESWADELNVLWQGQYVRQDVDLKFTTANLPQEVRQLDGDKTTLTLVQLQTSNLQQAIEILEPYRDSSPTPYAQDKLAIASSRIKLCKLMQRRLDSAYEAFGNNMERVPGRTKLEAEQQTLIRQFAELHNKAQIAEASE